MSKGSTQEVAPGVHCLPVGKGFMRANVFFVQSETSWTLVDAGSPSSGPAIVKAAESLFGAGSPPASILLTHDHPDHSGAARELAVLWGRPIWVHPDELPMTLGNIATYHEYAHPLDRWVVLPMLRLMGTRRAQAITSRASLEDVVRALDQGAAPPGLPDWEVVPTRGHTPGHIALFRKTDRVLISGDALLTMDFGSLGGLLFEKQRVAGPPWYVTWDRRAARAAIASLAELEPLVVAGGHGTPMAGVDMPAKVYAYATSLKRRQ